MICLNSCRKRTLGFVAAVLALMAAVYFGLGRRPPAQEATDPKAVSRAAIEALFAARLTDDHGASKAIGDWRNKILVANFWASWCQPCREEMPAFSRLQEKYAEQGVQFVGIAVDSAKNVADFSERLKVNYPLLIAEADGGELMRQLGNVQRGLPYTIVIQRDGSAGLVQLGKLSEKTLDEYLRTASRPN